MGVPFFVGVRWVAGGQRRPPLRKRILRCVGEGLCPSRGRGNRRSAASGGCSEPVSRKCLDWRTRQWPSVGWHDGGQEDPAPTEAQQEVQWAGDRKGRPYESVTRGAGESGIPQSRCCRDCFPYARESLGRGIRMSLLLCPKFLRCLAADAGNFDRGHSLTSLPLPLAALGSLPTGALCPRNDSVFS